MIQLNPQTFSRATEKARAVKPRVIHIGAHYGVRRSDGGTAIVRFTARAGALWASCSCPAGDPRTRRSPQPCYHIAAAVLFGGSSASASPAPATAPAAGDTGNTVPSAQHTRGALHSHVCPRCGDLWHCLARGCDGDPLPCDSCDQYEADRLTWSGVYGAGIAWQ